MESSKPVCRHLPSFVFIIFIFGFAIWFLINPKADYSSSEKRYLQKFPTVSVNSVLDGKFGTDFEKYFADHFPMRTQWVGQTLTLIFRLATTVLTECITVRTATL